MNILITKGDPTHADVLAMIRESDAYYDELYPAESNHLMDAASLLQQDVSFFVALKDGDICGFGSVVDFKTYGEIKRMYVRPSMRGYGIGRKLLIQIESRAIELGLQKMRLETGIKQPGAIGLYKTHGYVEIAEFGKYQPDPLSVFMEKEL